MAKQVRVSFSVTRTINLGNYESVKVQAGLEVQCDRDADAIAEATKEVRKYVDTRIKQETLKWQV